jgi:hypothetical protein
MFQKDKMPRKNSENEATLNYNQTENQANSENLLNKPASRYFSQLGEQLGGLRDNILSSICVEH